MACLLAGIGSLIVLLSTSTMLADWAPPEMRSEVDSLVNQAPLDAYDLSAAQVLEWMRLGMMAVAAASVAAIILAIYTVRGHRGSRIALTIVSATSSLMFVASGLAGLLPAAMAIGCVILLWSREANDWFNPERARKRAEAAEAAARAETPASVAPETAHVEGSGEQQQARPADIPFGTAQPPVHSRPYARAPQPSGQHPQQSRLPGTVLAAMLTATIMSGLVVLAGVVVLAGYAASPGDLGAELLDQPALENNPQIESLGWSADTLGRAVVYVMAAICALALAAIGSAVWMLRRSNAARIVLVVLCGITIAVSVLATIVGIPWIAAAIVVIVLVFRPSANAYFRRPERA